MNDIIKIVDLHRKYWICSDDEGSILKSQIINGEDVLSRQNWSGHITASALVINEKSEQVLFINSIKFSRYLLPGGHLEPGESIYAASLRELYEETGLSTTRSLSIVSELPIPLEINTHTIAANEKRSEPSHTHHDFVYGFLTNHDQVFHLASNEEATELSWLDLSALASTYPKSLDRVTKLLGEVR